MTATLPSLVVDARMIAHSGIGTYLRNILGRIRKMDTFRIRLLGDGKLLAEQGFSDGYEIVDLFSGIYDPRSHWALARRIPDCDLYWSPHFNVTLLPVRARKRLVTIHDAYHLAHPQAFGSLARRYGRMLFLGAVRISDRIITVSEFSKREIIRFAGGAGKIEMVPNGVAQDYGAGFRFSRIEEDYLLFVGNVKPHKNLGTLLRAFAKIESRFPGLKLYIVGRTEGLLSPDVEINSLVAALPQGRVRILGEVSGQDLKNYYANARLFVFPSLYEGFGLPVLEAMAFGIPIAASRMGPIPEVAGDEIAYFDPLDAHGMAESLAEVLGGPRKDLSAAYGERVRRFTWEKAAAAHHGIMAGMIASEQKG